MAGNIGKRFLKDTENRGGAVSIKHNILEVDVNRTFYSRMRLEFFGVPFHGWYNTKVIQYTGP